MANASMKCVLTPPSRIICIEAWVFAIFGSLRVKIIAQRRRLDLKRPLEFRCSTNTAREEKPNTDIDCCLARIISGWQNGQHRSLESGLPLAPLSHLLHAFVQRQH